MSTKKALVQASFEEIGLGTYIFDAKPEQLEGAKKRLDRIATMYDGLGIRLGYNIDGGLDSESGLPDTAEDTFICALAMSIAPTYGKTTQVETRARFNMGYNALMVARYNPIPQVQYPGTMPVGVGSGRGVKDNPYYTPVDPLTTGDDVLEF